MCSVTTPSMLCNSGKSWTDPGFKDYSFFKDPIHNNGGCEISSNTFACLFFKKESEKYLKVCYLLAMLCWRT